MFIDGAFYVEPSKQDYMDFNVDDDETVERLWLVVRSVRPKQETDVSCKSTLPDLLNIYHVLQLFP